MNILSPDSTQPPPGSLLETLIGDGAKAPAEMPSGSSEVPTIVPAANATTAGAVRAGHLEMASAGIPRDVRPLTEREIVASAEKFAVLSPGVPLTKLLIVRYGNRFRGLEPVCGELTYGRERDLAELTQWISEIAPLIQPLMAVFTVNQETEAKERKKLPQILDEYATLLAGSLVQDLTIAESSSSTTSSCSTQTRRATAATTSRATSSTSA
jgi:hypothetical protein